MGKPKYSDEVKEFIKVKLESNPNNTAIARDVKKHFDIPQELDAVRRTISDFRRMWKIEARQKPIKRLFFDIETSYCTVRSWRLGKNYLTTDKLIEPSKIICISYKWQYENKVHSLTWDKRQNEYKMLKEFVNVLDSADEVQGHNIENFDIKVLRTRCIANNILMYPTYRTLDTLKKARQYFRFESNKLDYIGKFFEVGGKLEHEGIKLWIDVVEKNDEKALSRMVKYCERDVALLEDAYFIMAPYIWHNTNFAVLKGGHKWECPECASDNVLMYRTYTTAMGVIRRNMKCESCRKQYRISNLTYLSMLKYLDRQRRKK
jgi:DNA polymerase elongation subunit (family B)